MTASNSNQANVDNVVKTIKPEAIWELVHGVSAFDVNIDWYHSFQGLLEKLLRGQDAFETKEAQRMMELLDLIESNHPLAQNGEGGEQLNNVRKLVDARCPSWSQAGSQDKADPQSGSPARRAASSRRMGQGSDEEVFHGRYKRLKKLGSGAMGVVYLGQDPDSGEQVALKLLHLRNLHNIKDIQNEARAAMKVDHENCVKVMGILEDRIWDPLYSEYKQLPIVVSEYVRGQSLGDFLEHKMFEGLKPRRSFSKLAALLIIEQILRGLTAVHAAGVIHRDIKPDNCIITQEVIDALVEAYRKNWGLTATIIEDIFINQRASGKAWIKISDLGSALITEAEDDGRTFSVQKFLPGGSPAYMAPESVRDEVSGRTDIFSLGMTFYQLLTGRNPREAREVAEGIDALKYKSSYLYLEDLRKSKVSHSVDLEADPAFSHFLDKSGQLKAPRVLELLKQMTVRDRKSRIRTRTCEMCTSLLIDSELSTRKAKKYQDQVANGQGSQAELEKENKGIKAYYSSQIKSYQAKLKMAQALEQNLENELSHKDTLIKAEKAKAAEAALQTERAQRHLKAITDTKEEVEQELEDMKIQLQSLQDTYRSRERSFSESEERIAQFKKQAQEERAKRLELERIVSEKQGYAVSMSEKIAGLQSQLSEIANLNQFMQIAESLSMFPTQAGLAGAFEEADSAPAPAPALPDLSEEERAGLESKFSQIGERFSLGEWPIDERRLPYWLKAERLAVVKHLVIENTPVHPDMVRLIVESKHLKDVEILELKSCPVDIVLFKVLLEAECLTSLKSLRLEDNSLSLECVRALSRSRVLSPLGSISLVRNALCQDATAALCQSPKMPALKVLELVENGLTAAQLRELLGSHILQGLTTLRLDENDLGAEGWQYLADSDCLKQLKVLSLNGNRGGGLGLQLLLGAGSSLQLEELHLEQNELGADGARQFEGAELGEGLKALSLGANAVGDEGCQSLARSDALVSLEYLDLGGNSISSIGVKALTDSPRFAKLRVLNLALNQIDDAGAQAIAKSQHFHALEDLNLSFNQIGKAGSEALLESPLLKRMKDMTL